MNTNPDAAPPAVYWLPALLLGALGAWIIFDAEPGINLLTWTAAAALGMVAVRRLSDRPLRTHTMVLLGWACVLTAGQAISANPAHTPIVVILSLLLLALSIITLDEPSAGRILIPTVIRTPFVALWRVGSQALMEIIAAPANAGAARSRPAVRGALLAAPVVIVLAILLSYSDPILDAARGSIAEFFAAWSISERFVFFLFLSAVCVGTYALGAGRRTQVAPDEMELTPPFRLGPQETTILLAAVNAVLWIYVVLQVASLAKNPAAVAGTGVTYAEYARRGFAELSIAAAIVLVVLLVVQVLAEKREQRPIRLELLSIAAIELILLSAFRRVLLYEAAYGFTTERLVAQAFMIVLAIGFVLLALDLRRGPLTSAFSRKMMMVSLAAVTAFLFWNYEGWLVGQNLARSAETGKRDIAYLARLSPNAAPALVASRSALTEPERAVVDSALACSRIPVADSWYEWNMRREKARTAIGGLGLSCDRAKPKPVAPAPAPVSPTP